MSATLPKTKITPQMKNIINKANKDYDNLITKQRFGYFSIPANNLLGDCFYSREKQFNHTIIDGKVVSEKRGIFTQPPKSGKGRDVYFKCMDSTDNNSQNILKQGNIKDHDDLIKKVAQRKIKKFTDPFKYPGAQTYKDWYDKHPFKRDYPLYKPKPKTYKIEDQKVITENRGIYTNNMQKGSYNTPGILFSYVPLGYNKKDKFDFDKIKQERQQEIKNRCKSAHPGKTDYKRAFFPASLKKNECFSNIKQTYGYTPDYYSKLQKQSEIDRKKKSQPYKKEYPKGSAHHDRPFSPASLSKSGRDGLFNKRVWDCPSVPEKRVIVSAKQREEEERKNRKNPFIYNRLMDPSDFSPSIVNNQINLKNNYPSVYHF